MTISTEVNLLKGLDALIDDKGFSVETRQAAIDFKDLLGREINSIDKKERELRSFVANLRTDNN